MEVTQSKFVISETLIDKEIIELMCKFSLENIIKDIKSNILKLNDFSIILFSDFLNADKIDIQIYSDDTEDYSDIILKIPVTNKLNKIINYKYIRWEQKAIYDYNLNEIYPFDIKDHLKLQSEIKSIVHNYIEKISDAKIFNSLEELYKYLLINRSTRNNNKIKKLLKLKPLSIKEYIIKKESACLFDMLDLMNITLTINESKNLGAYLKTQMPKKSRERIFVENYGTNAYMMLFTWDELGTLEYMIEDWISNNLDNKIN